MAHEQTQVWIDKSEWGDGLWQDEPDRVDWRDDATGLPCLALRNATLGHWCGYVGLPPGHPWHGKGYEDLLSLPAHGGVNFVSKCDEGEGPDRVCHVPLPGEPDDVWWIGFDCGHYGDLSPGTLLLDRVLHDHGFVMPVFGRGEYRSLDYVRRCCTEMAVEAGRTASS